MSKLYLIIFAHLNFIIRWGGTGLEGRDGYMGKGTFFMIDTKAEIIY